MVLARIDLVIDEGGRQARLAGMDRQQFDALLAVGIGVALQPVALLAVLGDARGDGLVLDRGAVEGEQGHRRERLDGRGGAGLADEVAVAEMVTAGGEPLAQAALVGARQVSSTVPSATTTRLRPSSPPRR